MSIFDQPFNKTESCFGFYNGAPVPSNRPVPRNRPAHADGLTEEVKHDIQEIDEILSEALTKLTFEEREEHQEVIHGVKDTTVDDEAILEPALQDLESHIENMKSDSVYEMAESIDPAYVSARPFRAMFLRAKEYDAKAAAEQMLLFFESKHQLFGIDKLVKDITIADLDDDDIACLNHSNLQLGGRDRSGRQVLINIASLTEALGSEKTKKNLLRAQYYVIMKALQSKETQIRGTVSVLYGIGNLKAKSNKGWSEGTKHNRALPQKRAAIHLCIDDMKQYALCLVLVKLISAPSVKAKIRLHFGSVIECKYKLSTFGILSESIPLDASGNINLDRQLHWVQFCAREEQPDRHILPSDRALDTSTISPGQNDVLFTGGKVISHGGNERYRRLIFYFSQAYDTGTDEVKRQIVGEIIEKVREDGGCFLKEKGKGPNKSWEEVPIEILRKKIMQAFRNRRRRQDVSKETSILIAGEPLPRDVIFGRARKNPGSELLQRLIKDNSQEYESLSRGVKMRHVESIMQTLKDQGGRFLEEAAEKGRWVELPNDTARERISTYFRNYRRRSSKVQAKI
ncbi:unnamed protein product [Cylindrotheca closterium]|uniref:DUF6824 domain-containing protein n=1 Tax=Cylindrotheca closterium TaxID=2856 RepID=A0AAD2JN83_9STRA|nr:unnamed protein product [Cylindrotheca closterium]